MKTLYFDIDGTVVRSDGSEPKPRLAGGNFEAAVRRAGFNRLVCVGNFTRAAHLMRKVRREYDQLGALFGLCRGTFADEAWFRSVTGLVSDPGNRFKHV